MEETAKDRYKWRPLVEWPMPQTGVKTVRMDQDLIWNTHTYGKAYKYTEEKVGEKESKLSWIQMREHWLRDYASLDEKRDDSNEVEFIFQKVL